MQWSPCQINWFYYLCILFLFVDLLCLSVCKPVESIVEINVLEMCTSTLAHSQQFKSHAVVWWWSMILDFIHIQCKHFEGRCNAISSCMHLYGNLIRQLFVWHIHFAYFYFKAWNDFPHIHIFDAQNLRFAKSAMDSIWPYILILI